MSAPLATRPVQILQKTYQLPLLQGGTLQELQDRIQTRQIQIRQGTVTRSRLKGLLKQTQELSAQQRLDLLNAQIRDYRGLIQLVTSHKEAYQRFLLALAGEVRQVFAQKCQQIQRDEQERARDEAYARQRNNPALVVNLRQEKRELLEELVLLDKAASLMLKKIDLICQGLDRIAADKGLQENLVLGLVHDLELYSRSISRRHRAQERREDTQHFADMALNLEEYMRQYLGPFQQLIDQTAVTDQEMSRTVLEISQLAEEVLGTTVNLASSDELLKFEVVSAEIQDHLDLTLERTAMERNWAGGGLGIISDQRLDATSVEAAINQIQGYLQEELGKQQELIIGSWDIDAVPLESERGVDYRKLRDLLKTKDWQLADQETGRIMCQVVNCVEHGWLRAEDITQFPCMDLRTIDQLWVQASRGCYGFSVQKKIWQECGSPTQYNKDWKQFCQQVGWRIETQWVSYADLIWDWDGNCDTGVPGHLPFRGVWYWYWSLRAYGWAGWWWLLAGGFVGALLDAYWIVWWWLLLGGWIYGFSKIDGSVEVCIDSLGTLLSRQDL